MTFLMELVELRMGPHKETSSFIVAPGMYHPIVSLDYRNGIPRSIGRKTFCKSIGNPTHPKATVKEELDSLTLLVKNVKGKRMVPDCKWGGTICLILK